jgi:hypothetical protein
MSALLHLSHHLFFNLLLTAAVLALLWLLVYVISTEVAWRVPVQIIAPF